MAPCLLSRTRLRVMVAFRVIAMLQLEGQGVHRPVVVGGGCAKVARGPAARVPKRELSLTCCSEPDAPFRQRFNSLS